MRFRDLFPFPWNLKYYLWRASGARTAVSLRLKEGGQIRLRGRGTHDYGCAYEVFVQNPYRTTLPSPPQVIVDLGANVGYSILYFANRYPTAQIHAFEPHPVHAKLAAELVSYNGLNHRVTVIPAAAGTREGQLFLTNSGTSSRLTSTQGKDRIPVEVRDFLEWGKSLGMIDLLKIDIEGAEYALFEDDRLKDLPCRAMVIEWHVREDRPDAEQWFLSRLRQCGYTAEAVPEAPGQRPGGGLIHARRP